MKNEQKSMVGLCGMMVGLVWIACRGIPHLRYRYAHPELTDTQLQLIFLSSLCWWDLIPISLFAFGVVLMMRSSR